MITRHPTHASIQTAEFAVGTMMGRAGSIDLVLNQVRMSPCWRHIGSAHHGGLLRYPH